MIVLLLNLTPKCIFSSLLKFVHIQILITSKYYSRLVVWFHY